MGRQGLDRMFRAPVTEAADAALDDLEHAAFRSHLGERLSSAVHVFTLVSETIVLVIAP